MPRLLTGLVLAAAALIVPAEYSRALANPESGSDLQSRDDNSREASRNRPYPVYWVEFWTQKDADTIIRWFSGGGNTLYDFKIQGAGDQLNVAFFLLMKNDFPYFRELWIDMYGAGRSRTKRNRILRREREIWEKQSDFNESVMKRLEAKYGTTAPGPNWSAADAVEWNARSLQNALIVSKLTVIITWFEDSMQGAPPAN